jgi:hypothetical protein
MPGHQPETQRPIVPSCTTKGHPSRTEQSLRCRFARPASWPLPNGKLLISQGVAEINRSGTSCRSAWSSNLNRFDAPILESLLFENECDSLFITAPVLTWAGPRSRGRR